MGGTVLRKRNSKPAVPVPAPTSAEGCTTSPISGTEDTADQRASLRSFAGSGRKRKYCIAIWLQGFGGGFDPLPRWMEFLLRCAVSKYLGHFPEGLIEFHILIDALDCPALGHPATIRAAARTVTLTTANDVFLDTVQRGPEIFGSVSVTSWIKKHGGTYRGFCEVFPAISRRASGES